MANIQRPKVGNKAKSRQSVHNRTYYENYRRKYQTKLIQRRAKREKNIKVALNKPKKEHPSNIRRRMRRSRFFN
jgi:hypothetical protein